MQKSNPEILNHFYGLLLDMNYQISDADLNEEINLKNDAFIEKHLRNIRLQSAKYRALLNRNRFSAILKEIKRLKEIGFEEINKLLSQDEARQLQPLFRRFEEISKNDEASIEEDQEILRLISVLNDKLKKKDHNE